MLIQINVEELRRIALLSDDAAVKMNDSNTSVSTVVSKHDWKCPERVSIDESLEAIKSNSVVLNNAFEDFAAKIVELANNYTEYINNQIRDEAECNEELADIINMLSFGGSTARVSGGTNTSGLTDTLKASSMNESNIISLQGASNRINIMNFSSLRNDQ